MRVPGPRKARRGRARRSSCPPQVPDLRLAWLESRRRGDQAGEPAAPPPHTWLQDQGLRPGPRPAGSATAARQRERARREPGRRARRQVEAARPETRGLERDGRDGGLGEEQAETLPDLANLPKGGGKGIRKHSGEWSNTGQILVKHRRTDPENSGGSGKANDSPRETCASVPRCCARNSRLTLTGRSFTPDLHLIYTYSSSHDAHDGTVSDLSAAELKIPTAHRLLHLSCS
jgi:hypothetical protein